MKSSTIGRLYSVTKKFEEENNSKTTAVLFNKKGDEYKLMFASECLDDLSPYDSILEVVKYIKANEESLLRDLYFSIMTVHTEDESIMEIRETCIEGVKYMKTAELFYDELSEVYIMM